MVESREPDIISPPGPCLDGGEHALVQIVAWENALPIRTYCERCGKDAIVRRGSVPHDGPRLNPH